MLKYHLVHSVFQSSDTHVLPANQNLETKGQQISNIIVEMLFESSNKKLLYSSNAKREFLNLVRTFFTKEIEHQTKELAKIIFLPNEFSDRKYLDSILSCIIKLNNSLQPDF